MLATFGILFVLGLSLAQEPFDSSHLRTRLAQWAEQKTKELINDVDKVVSNVEQLVEKADSPRVRTLVSLLQEAQGSLSQCEEFSGYEWSEESSCLNITNDIADMTEVGYYGYELMGSMAGDIAAIVNELNQCQGMSIFKQIGCYKQAFSDIQAALKEYTIQCSQFLQNGTAVCYRFEKDVAHCFSFSESESSFQFEKKVHSCKQQVFF